MMPKSLQNLKDQASEIQRDRFAIEDEEAEQWWGLLLAEALRSLGPLWEFVTNKGRPPTFSRRHATHEFIIEIPSHRLIVVVFHVLHSGDAFWRRGLYSGRTEDVDGGRAAWMVSQRPGRDLPSYHQTLGSALLAAEIKG